AHAIEPGLILVKQVEDSGWITLDSTLSLANGARLYGGFDPSLTGTSHSLAGRALDSFNGTRIELEGGGDVVECNGAEGVVIDGFVLGRPELNDSFDNRGLVLTECGPIRVANVKVENLFHSPVAGVLWGVGVYCSNSTIEFENVRIEGNHGQGALLGGGSAFSVCDGSLEGVAFIGNTAEGFSAEGGTGDVVFGGGAFVYYSTLTFNNITVRENQALGGSGQGPGAGLGGAAYGVGLAIVASSPVVITNGSFIENSAVGGQGRTGEDADSEPNVEECVQPPTQGGDGANALGGGLYADVPSLSVADTSFALNSAAYGLGGPGGAGSGACSGGANGANGKAFGGGVAHNGEFLEGEGVSFANNGPDNVADVSE
ncbi:MAG: hypothetical protein KC561_16015, partial [Myxococcales bacterium]|nr:hypothetical protein [Myxococcales bacterium]